MAKLNFGGVEENVVTRDEFPLSKAQDVLKDETVAVIGYGVQGPGQALNQRENGIRVIVGQRKDSKSWDKAVADGFVPGESLFEIEEALRRGTIICYLLSDAAQIALWPTVKSHLTAGKALYFSHGFGITYRDQTGIVPPPDVDVFLVAPKGSGTSLRRMFLQGRGLNSSYAIHQDATGRAFERVVALGIAIGSGYLFETSFQAQFLIPMATALAFGLATTTLLVLILVPVMYSFFGTSAREEHEEEYLPGHDPARAGAAGSVAPDEAEQEWLPDHLREPRPESAGV